MLPLLLLLPKAKDVLVSFNKENFFELPKLDSDPSLLLILCLLLLLLLLMLLQLISHSLIDRMIDHTDESFVSFMVRISLVRRRVGRVHKAARNTRGRNGGIARQRTIKVLEQTEMHTKTELVEMHLEHATAGLLDGLDGASGRVGDLDRDRLNEVATTSKQFDTVRQNSVALEHASQHQRAHRDRLLRVDAAAIDEILQSIQIQRLMCNAELLVGKAEFALRFIQRRLAAFKAWTHTTTTKK
jgi:hypothetical protein